MLNYTGALLLPTSMTIQERQARVDQIISSFRLEGIRDVTIGGVLNRGISGGEAKRLNIALAILPLLSPGVLFLDEPTTGPVSMQSVRDRNLSSSSVSHPRRSGQQHGERDISHPA